MVKLFLFLAQPFNFSMAKCSNYIQQQVNPDTGDINFDIVLSTGSGIFLYENLN